MKYAAAVFAIILVLAAIATAVCRSPIGYAIAQIHRMESAMRQPGVYEPVAQRLALYCQSDQKPFPHHLTSAWFPAELREVGQGWGTVDSNSAHIEMGGGFHHFGYTLYFDESESTEATNVWRLQFYSEDSDTENLTTVSLKKNQRLTPIEIMTLVANGYDAQIAATPDDGTAHQEKIQMYLRFERVAEAREASRAMLETMPDDWWAVLVNTLLDDALGDKAIAEKSIIGWVDKAPNYFRYLDLAYFYQLTDQPTKASDAIEQACKFNANTEWGHGGNAQYRGYTAAMYAYESGNFAQCEQLCEKLVGVSINGNYGKRGLDDLRQAAIRRKRGENAVVTWDAEILPFDAFETIDLEKLLGRDVARPTKSGAREL